VDKNVLCCCCERKGARENEIRGWSPHSPGRPGGGIETARAGGEAWKRPLVQKLSCFGPFLSKENEWGQGKRSGRKGCSKDADLKNEGTKGPSGAMRGGGTDSPVPEQRRVGATSKS